MPIFCNSLSMRALPDPADIFRDPEFRAAAAEQRAARHAAAIAERKQREADKAAEIAARKAIADKQARERREALRLKARRKKRLSRTKRNARRGRKAALYVVRWAYYRALSANTVTWKERHNWVRRLLYKIEKQVREKTIDQLGSVDLFQADDKFYEEVARMVFMCYRKTGDAPAESDARDGVAFRL